MVSKTWLQKGHADQARPVIKQELESHHLLEKQTLHPQQTWMNVLKKSAQTTTSTLFQRRFEFKKVMSQNSHESARWRRFCELYKPVNHIREEEALHPPSKDLMSLPNTQSHVDHRPSTVKRSPMEMALRHIPKDILEHREWKEIRRIGPGLQNLGNTCFMNSVLQCLVYCPPLNYHLIASKHSQKCKVLGFCGYCELEQHVRHCFYLKPMVRSIAPKRFATHLRAICKQFRLGRQEDAHEFIRCLLDSVEKSYIQAHYGEELLIPSRKMKQSTIVQHIFGGQLQSQVKCLSCKNESNTYDPFLDICLDIKNCSTIEKAFSQYTLPEKLSRDNRYQCGKCHQRVEAEKRMTIHCVPAILTVQLKRFDYFAGYGGKIGKHIHFSESLDLGPYMSKEFAGANLNYRLFAVLVHAGQTCNSGHYYCYVRNATETWYCMNDDSVYQTSFTKVMQEPAYLLFYVLDKPEPREISKGDLSNEFIAESKTERISENETMSRTNRIVKHMNHDANDISNVDRTCRFPFQDLGLKSLLNRDFQAEVSSEDEDQRDQKYEDKTLGESTRWTMNEMRPIKKKSNNNLSKNEHHCLSGKMSNDVSTKTVDPWLIKNDDRNDIPSKIDKSSSSSVSRSIQTLLRRGSLSIAHDTMIQSKADIQVFAETTQLHDLSAKNFTRKEYPDDIPFRDHCQRPLMHSHNADGVLAFHKEIQEMDARKDHCLWDQPVVTWNGDISHSNVSLECDQPLEPLGKTLDIYDIQYDRGKLKKEPKQRAVPNEVPNHNIFQDLQNARSKKRRNDHDTSSFSIRGKKFHRHRRNSFQKKKRKFMNGSFM